MSLYTHLCDRRLDFLGDLIREIERNSVLLMLVAGPRNG